MNNFRFHWSAEPGIDISTGPAVAVRAYLESFSVAQATLDLGNAYAGFLRATPENQERVGNYSYQRINIRPLAFPTSATKNDAVPQFGYEAFRFLELTPTQNGYRAIVCSGSYATFVQSTSQPGKFVSVVADANTGRPSRPDATGVYAHQIELTQNDPRGTPTPPPSPAGPQIGPQPAPSRDVFGSWFITGAGLSHWGPVNGPDPLQPDLQPRCEAAMPQSEPERRELLSGFKDQPPPHGAAEPGWPA